MENNNYFNLWSQNITSIYPQWKKMVTSKWTGAIQELTSLNQHSYINLYQQNSISWVKSGRIAY